MPRGGAEYDRCSVCRGPAELPCQLDCAGEWGGIIKLDNCSVCGGDNSTCSTTPQRLGGGSCTSDAGVLNAIKSRCVTRNSNSTYKPRCFV